MTSTTIYTVYRSTDSSAPALNNTAGSLIALLDAVLVNGYGSKAAAGWTKAFSGTNKAAYKQGTGSNGFYLRVDDTGTTNARVVGYETMSDVDTGTNPFPSAAQVSGGGYMLKSNTGSVSWSILANASGFYFESNWSSSNRPSYFFGDDDSLLTTTDSYLTLHQCNTTTSISSLTLPNNQTTTSQFNGGFVARGYTLTGTSALIGNRTNYAINGSSLGNGGSSYPDPVTGGLLYSKCAIVESGLITRGYKRSVLVPLHAQPLTEWDTFTGTDDYAGQTFTVWSPGSMQLFIRTA